MKRLAVSIALSLICAAWLAASPASQYSDFAIESLNKGRDDEALGWLRKAINVYQEGIDSPFFRSQLLMSVGSVYERTRRFESAIDAYSECLVDSAAQYSALFARGRCRYLLGDYKQAFSDLYSADLNTDRGLRGWIEVGMTMPNTRSSVLAYLTRDQWAECLFYLGFTMLDMGGKNASANAAVAFNKMLTIKSDSSGNALFGLAHCYKSNGDMQTALACLKASAALGNGIAGKTLEAWTAPK